MSHHPVAPADTASPRPALQLMWVLTAIAGVWLFVTGTQAMAADRCRGLTVLALPHVHIVEAKAIEGKFTEEGEGGKTTIHAGLPAFCRVEGISSPVPGSRIGFEVWLPLSGWTGRLHMVGNSGYDGTIYYAQIAQRVREGDVGVGTDTGHSGSSTRFGWHDPVKIADFGYRAVHEAALAAKAITAAFYGRPAAHAYFSGCSTGGFQALAEAQRYPEDFDGIIAGAPGNNRMRLVLSFLWNYQANHGEGAGPLIGAAELQFVKTAIVKACDGNDGVLDGVIGDPRQCGFRVVSLRCRPGDKPGSCLSDAQIAAFEKIYRGPVNPVTGEQIYPGLPLGSEGGFARTNSKTPGWSAYLSDTGEPGAPDQPARFGILQDWVFDDQRLDWRTFDWDRDANRAIGALKADFEANDSDLSRFAARGGKLIMFMGWEDPVGSALEAINYYERVRARADNQAADKAVQDYLRLFMVPGMAHCNGGPGATNFSSATSHSMPPANDPEHNMARAIEAWVEKGRTPEELIATRLRSGDSPVGKGFPSDPADTAFQRPLCVYPKKSIYVGGDQSRAKSFACR